jgi:hypothetical protein
VSRGGRAAPADAVVAVQRQLHAIYDVEAPDVRAFLVPPEHAGAYTRGLRPSREWVLVRQQANAVDIGVVLDPGDLGAVASRTPADAVRHAFAAWANLAEGVSHFLLLFRRASRDEEVSMLELEVQAEVDKFVTAWFLGAPEGEVRRRLFEGVDLADGMTPGEVERYREAGRLAGPFCRRLGELRDFDAVMAELRRFYRRSGHQRLGDLRRAA